MTSERKFSELLSEAPLATNEGTVSLVGALQRSQEQGKFVLVLDGGQNIALDVQDVKEYQVLGEMIGQKIVRIEIDRHKVPGGLGITGSPHQGAVGNPASSAVPFVLLTSHHAPPGAVAAIYKTWDTSTTQLYLDVVTGPSETLGPEGIPFTVPILDYGSSR